MSSLWKSQQGGGTGTVTPTSVDTLTNKRITSRVLAITSGTATPAINTDNYDVVNITNIGIPITSMSSGLTGTPAVGDCRTTTFLDNGVGKGILWGASYEDSLVAHPTTTVAGQLLTVFDMWNAVTSKWRCMGYV